MYDFQSCFNADGCAGPDPLPPVGAVGRGEGVRPGSDIRCEARFDCDCKDMDGLGGLVLEMVDAYGGWYG